MAHPDYCFNVTNIDADFGLPKILLRWRCQELTWAASLLSQVPLTGSKLHSSNRFGKFSKRLLLLKLVSEACCNGGALTYWGGKFFTALGRGKALTLQAEGPHRFSRLENAWKQLSEQAICTNLKGDSNRLPGGIMLPLAFGSFDFSTDGGGQLIIPEFTVFISDNRLFLLSVKTVTENKNSTMPEIGLSDEALIQLEEQIQLLFAEATETAPAYRQSKSEDEIPAAFLSTRAGTIPDTEWKAAVETAKQRIASHRLEKIVLARDVFVDTKVAVDPLQILDYFKRHYPTCWRYAIGDLIGASPEMLAQLHDGKLLCRVLAGTCKRGCEAELLRSEKERYEHRLAAESARDALLKVIPNLPPLSQPFLLHLPNMTHYATDISIEHVDVSSLEAAAALHPTAAVCGTPREVAEPMITELERMNRGSYAGPIGWIGADGSGEWALALRCAQVTDDSFTRFRALAGAGILADSNAQGELAETNTKMTPIFEALRYAQSCPALNLD